MASSLGVYFLLMLLPVIIIYLFRRKPTRNPKSKKLPPGPFSWPLLGTRLKNPSQIHVELMELAKTYGPLIRLHFGVVPMIVGSTPAAAMALLKEQDRILSSRSVFHTSNIKGFIEHSFIFNDCNDQWKLIRRLLRTKLFSTKMLNAHTPVREAKVADLLHFLSRRSSSKQVGLPQAVDLYKLIYAVSLNALGWVIYSQDVCDFDDYDKDTGLKGLLRQILVIAATPNLADLYPVLWRWDVQGLQKASAECLERTNATWAGIVKERRAISKDQHSDSKNDFLQMLIDSGFDDAQIDALLLETFGPGSDTTTAVTVWAMAELMKNPSKMMKLREEVDRVIGRNKAVKDSDLPNLPYVHAVMKETLRMHPPLPLLIVHCASDTCEVLNYTIPKGCQVSVNAHALGMDATSWPRPSSFQPERFLGSDVDYQGNDYHYIPFGAGRRMCPGAPMASRFIRLLLASLIHSFDWILPDGMSPEGLDMTERFDSSLSKDAPLLVIPTARSA